VTDTIPATVPLSKGEMIFTVGRILSREFPKDLGTTLPGGKKSFSHSNAEYSTTLFCMCKLRLLRPDEEPREIADILRIMHKPKRTTYLFFMMLSYI
jgi:hypothetical protein